MRTWARTWRAAIAAVAKDVEAMDSIAWAADSARFESQLRGIDEAIAALKNEDGSWHYNPSEDTTLSPGLGVIFVGSPEARRAIADAAGES